MLGNSSLCYKGFITVASLRKRCSLLNSFANLRILYKIENREASKKPDHDTWVKILETYDLTSIPRLQRNGENARSSGKTYSQHVAVITGHVHPAVRPHMRSFGLRDVRLNFMNFSNFFRFRTGSKTLVQELIQALRHRFKC